MLPSISVRFRLSSFSTLSSILLIISIGKFKASVVPVSSIHTSSSSRSLIFNAIII